MEPLARAAKEHAKEWIGCYGGVLQESAKSSLFALKKQLEVSDL